MLPETGDRAPEFLLPPEDGMLTSFYERYCGRPTVLLLAHEPDAFVPFAPLGESIALLGLLPGASGVKIPAVIPAMQDHGRLTTMLGLPKKRDEGQEAPQVRLLDRQPDAGGAIVFSGALLHEATDVTRGTRHVLLTFMWGDEATR